MTNSVSFNRTHRVTPGVLETLRPGLRRITASNASPFTFHGTGTLVIGTGEVAVLDPGPADLGHIQALVDALTGESITHILVSHTHADHSPGAAMLQNSVDAPTYGYGPHGVIRHKTDSREILSGADEGGDLDFVPDIVVNDGDIIDGTDWSLEALHTPGHTSNHLCFAEKSTNSLFTGDHVMAWSTSIVSPPDGDMGDYIRSLRRLLDRSDQIYWPIHGGPVTEPKSFVRSLIAHREQREGQVLQAVRAGYRTVEAMVPVIYTDLDTALYPAAARSLFATVLYLVEQGLLQTEGAPGISSGYSAS